MTRFYLLRHGSTDDLGERISGWLPVSLNIQGEREVARLAERLVSLEIDVLYTSPIERARQTAAAIARVLKLQPIDCDPLGELQYGDWTGAPLSVL
ncbi:MAG TPA: histidine phosphatase family protein, partial [Polyangiales bacterium]|nr:histidine phosphatase family protein [Polyangiales bacterium]